MSASNDDDDDDDINCKSEINFRKYRTKIYSSNVNSQRKNKKKKVNESIFICQLCS